MKTNPLLKIQEFGQSIWLDFIRRDMLVSGELKRLIDQDGLRGMTSNPAIFEKAIGETQDYVTAIHRLAIERIFFPVSDFAVLQKKGLNPACALGQVTQKLEDEGVEKFIKPFDLLINSLDKKRKDILVDQN